MGCGMVEGMDDAAGGDVEGMTTMGKVGSGGRVSWE